MKSAKDWLNSSSSSDGGASSPSPSAAGTGVSSAAAAESAPAAPSAAEAARQKRAQEAEERRRKAAELREKMKETLGADAVPPPREDTEGPPKSLQSPVIIRRKSSGAAAPAPKPSLKDRLKGVLDSSTETSHNGTPLNSGGGPPPFMPPVRPMSTDAVAMPANDDEVVIMVADRGCQTVCEIETQTDPEPHTVSCPMCYSAYYGHSGAPPPLCGSHNPAPVYMFGGAHGPAVQPMHPHMHGPAGIQTAQALGARFGGYGGGATPQTQRLVPAHVYQRQVDLIQSRIDAIIRKHNLPEMPMAGLAAGQ